MTKFGTFYHFRCPYPSLLKTNLLRNSSELDEAGGGSREEVKRGRQINMRLRGHFNEVINWRQWSLLPRGAVRIEPLSCGMKQCNALTFNNVWYVMVWQNVVWYGMIWHGMVCVTIGNQERHFQAPQASLAHPPSVFGFHK